MAEATALWPIIALAVAFYCLARGVADIRRRSFVWGTLGIVAGAFLLLIPLPSHALKFDLPPPGHAGQGR